MEDFVSYLALLKVDMDYWERNPGISISKLAESCLHWVLRLADLQKHLLGIGIRVNLNPTQNNRKGLDVGRREGVILQAVTLQVGANHDGPRGL